MKKNSTLKALIRGGIGLLCCVSLAFPVGAEPAEDARVLDGGTLCTFGDSLTATVSYTHLTLPTIRLV